MSSVRVLQPSLHLSEYIRAHEVEPGVTGIYNPFGQDIEFIETKMWKLLQQDGFDDIDKSILDDLIKRQFVGEDKFEERILNAYQPPSGNIREMWLVVALACNMSCQYCVVTNSTPEKKGPKSKDTDSRMNNAKNVMSAKVAEFAVRMFSRHLQRSRPPCARVVFYGGEPLINKSAIRTALPLLREISYPGQEHPLSIMLITNGQIYDQAMVDLLKEHKVAVSVSLDGMKKHHDLVRLDNSGNPTFDKTIDNLRRYQANGLSTGICVTIGSHNVDDLPEIAEYLGSEFGVPVEFQVPYDFKAGGGNRYYVPMKDVAPKAMEAYRRLRDKGLIEGLALRRIRQFDQGEFRFSDCSAIGGQLVVAPDGMVGPCHSLVEERKYFNDNVCNSGCNPTEHENFKEWLRRMPINMPECHGCAAISLCGGGCPYNALVTKGSIWKKDPQQCEYMLYFIDWLLEDKWRQQKQGPKQVAKPVVF